MQILTLRACISLVITSYIYSAYAYADTLSKKTKSALELINIFDVFLFSGLKVDKEKCETAGISVKNGVKVTLSGVEFID